MSGFARFTVTAPGPFLDLSLTLLLIMDLSSQFGTVPVQFPCKTMMRTPRSLGLLPRFMFHGSKIDVYSHEKEALLSRYSSVQITVVISTLPCAEKSVLRHRMAHGHFRGILPASSSGWGERRKMLSGVEESWMRETFCYRLSQSNPFLIEGLFCPINKP